MEELERLREDLAGIDDQIAELYKKRVRDLREDRRCED